MKFLTQSYTEEAQRGAENFGRFFEIWDFFEGVFYGFGEEGFGGSGEGDGDCGGEAVAAAVGSGGIAALGGNAFGPASGGRGGLCGASGAFGLFGVCVF